MTSDAFSKDLLAEIYSNLDLSPDGFDESATHVPTVLNFSAYRDIPSVDQLSGIQAIAKPAHWGYQSLHKFSAHNETWLYSLDSLLVWLKWLDDGRFEKASEVLNKQQFPLV